MHDINLLRQLIGQEQEQAKSKSRSSSYITLAVILVILIFGIISGIKYYLVFESKSLDSQIANLAKDVSDIQAIEDNINDFNNTITQLKNLDKNKLAWSTIYDNIAKSTPANVKLTQVALISATASSKNTTTTSSTANKGTSTQASKLKITGEAKSRRAVALFANKLQKVGGNFQAVEIISSKKTESSSEETTTATTEKIDFEINITLKSG